MQRHCRACEQDIGQKFIRSLLPYLSWRLLFSQALPIITEDHRGIVYHLTLAVGLHQLHKLCCGLRLKGDLVSSLQREASVNRRTENAMIKDFLKIVEDQSIKEGLHSASLGREKS